MRALPLAIVSLLSSAAAAQGWKIAAGPDLPYPGSYRLQIHTLDDGRLMFDPRGAPEILSLDGRTWTRVDKAVGSGPIIPIPGGLLNATGGGVDHGIQWDLAHDTVTLTGGLVAARDEGEELATRLGDGSVLVVGGVDLQHGQRILAEAERWTAASGAFTAAGALRSPRIDGTITTLADGRALVAGGTAQYGRSGGTTSADIYDPATNKWTATGDLHVARRGHTATLLPDGRVLVAGGLSVSERGIAELEVWNPRTGKWSIVGRFREPRAYHAAVALPHGRVMFIGGTTRDGLYTHLENGVSALSAETWDVTGARWDPPFYPPHGYVRPEVGRLPDGRLVVAGGYDFTKLTVRVELWTWDTTTAPPPWELADPIPDPMDGAVDLACHNVPRRFANARWQPLPGLAADERAAIAALPAGAALVVGAQRGDNLGASVWDLKLRSWADVTMRTPRTSAAIAALADGRVFVAGGTGEPPRQARETMRGPVPPRLRSTEVFDPGTGKFTASHTMLVTRAGATATTLADGRVLVAGGDPKGTVEVWSPKTGRFARASSMHAPRVRHTATLLADGRVAVIGGDPHGTYTIYDPKTDRWTADLPLPEPWSGHGARLAPDGRVLVLIERCATHGVLLRL